LLREYYKVYFKVDDLKNVSLEELLDVIDPRTPISRLRFRKGASNLGALSDKPFAKIH
jgi:hypothetical protein